MNFKTIPIKDMINLWSIVQIVLELLTCPFVHGQLWRNIAEKKIRKKTKRIREVYLSIFSVIWLRANGRSFPAESLEVANHKHHVSQY